MSLDRRGFLKNALQAVGLSVVKPEALARAIDAGTRRDEDLSIKTTLESSGQKFQNGSEVFNVMIQPEGSQEKSRVGELWPIGQIDFLTKETHPDMFASDVSMATFLEEAGGIATAPDGMTKSANGYKLEGQSLSHGVGAGDGTIPRYGIVVLDARGRIIKFTHGLELATYDGSGNVTDRREFNRLYNQVKNDKGSLFFLPSVKRTFRGQEKRLESDKYLEQVLIRRLEPAVDTSGRRDPSAQPVETFKVMRFDPLVTYKEALKIIDGLERINSDGTHATTTHIYMLDGGSDWDSAAKRVGVNGGQVKTQVLSEGNRSIATAALIFY